MKSPADFWYRSRWHPVMLFWLPLLLPLSWLFCAVSRLRRQAYRLGLLPQRQWPVPLIVVGNIVAGGSGKTPMIIALCEHLRRRGYRPGVVSRGYGGSNRAVRSLTAQDSAAVVGDEPLMIHRLTGVPVVVSPDRPAAVDRLLREGDCDIVLSDDGLQHYRMGRSLEIAVVDAERGAGNGFCLPAGPLREPVSRLRSVDLVVCSIRGQMPPPKSGEVHYRLAPQPVYPLSAAMADRQASGRELKDFRERPIHAVAGIAQPSRFFGLLREQGLDIIEHAFGDHHAFHQNDFAGWSRDCIIMTEKDAVKCAGLSLTDAWVLPVRADFSPALKRQLDALLATLADGGRRR